MKMKPRILSQIIVFFLIVLLSFFLISRKEKIAVKEVDTKKIENFDIILSKGQSVQSKLISLLKLSINDYSHIGIMIKDNEEVFVLHSTPDGTKTNSIRYDNLQTFIDLSSVSEYIVLRYNDLSDDLYQKLRMEFDKYKAIKAPFDYDFNNFEHGKIYCSELVWLIFSDAGLFKPCDFNFEKPIYPKYFLKLNGIISININKSNQNFRDIE